MLVPTRVLADSLTIGTDFYAGRVVSMNAMGLEFDFSCSGDIHRLNLEPGMSIRIDKTCGEVEGFEFGGREQCQEKREFSKPFIYGIWYLLADGSGDTFIFDYFDYDGDNFAWGYDGNNGSAPIVKAIVDIEKPDFCLHESELYSDPKF